MFSGLFRSCAKAVGMGLAGGLGAVDSVARDIEHAEGIVDYAQHESVPERALMKFGAAVGAGAVKAGACSVTPSLH